jgi:hypothetical protein
VLLAGSGTSLYFGWQASVSAREARAALVEKEAADRRNRQLLQRVFRFLRKHPELLKRPGREIADRFLEENPDVPRQDLYDAVSDIPVSDWQPDGKTFAQPPGAGQSTAGSFAPNMFGD